MEVTHESRSFMIGKSPRLTPSDLLNAIRKNNNADSSFTSKPLESLNCTYQSKDGLMMMSNLKDLSTLDDALSPKKKQKAVVFVEANEYSDQSQALVDASESLTNRPKKAPKGILIRKGIGKSLPITPLKPNPEKLSENCSEKQRENKSPSISSTSSLLKMNKDVGTSSLSPLVFSRPTRTASFKQLGSTKEPQGTSALQRFLKDENAESSKANINATKFSLRREYSESSIKRDSRTGNLRLFTPSLGESRSFKLGNSNNRELEQKNAAFFQKPLTSGGSRDKLGLFDRSPMQKYNSEQKQHPLKLFESFNEADMSGFSQFDSPSIQLIKNVKNPYISQSQKSMKDNYLFSNINVPFDADASQLGNGFDQSQRNLVSESPLNLTLITNTEREGYSQRPGSKSFSVKTKEGILINSISQLLEGEKPSPDPGSRKTPRKMQQHIFFILNKQIVKYDLMKISYTIGTVPNFNIMDNYSYCNINNEYLFISGGIDRRSYSTSCSAFILDVNTLKVETMPGMITGRHSHTVACYKDKIFIFGGQSVDHKILQGCCILNIRERVWYKIPSMKIERKNSQFFVNNRSGVIYVLGGSNHSGSEIKIIEKLDTSKLSWSILRYDTSTGLNLRDFVILRAVNDDEDMVWILSRPKGRSTYELFSFDLDQEKFIYQADFPTLQAN